MLTGGKLRYSFLMSGWKLVPDFKNHCLRIKQVLYRIIIFITYMEFIP